MTKPTPSTYLSDHPPAHDPTNDGAIAVEVLASLMAVSAIGAIVLNWLLVYVTFFSVEPVVEPFNVAVYRVSLVAFAVGTVLAICAVWWRSARPGKSVYWHGLVAVVGLALAALCHVSA